MQDIDSEMKTKQILDYVDSLIHEYEILINNSVIQIEENGAKVTFRKIKRIKKKILFTLLKNVTS